MNISRTRIIALVAGASLVALALYTVSRRASSECLSPTELKSFEGSYARKETWDKLPVVKEWAKIDITSAGWIDAVQIMPTGETEGSLGWHESGAVCIQFRDEQLWASLANYSPNAPSEWQGPFVTLGKGVAVEQAYFDRIFQKACYRSNTGEIWCFGSSSIQVGNKKFQASLSLDQSEMPQYGTPVSVSGEERFWMFVPFEGGWKVFKDSFVTEQGHIDIDPSQVPPWRTLSPLLDGVAHG